MSDPQWLKPAEVAAALRVTTEAVYKMARAGEFTLIKWKDRELRIHRSEMYPPAPPVPKAREVRPIIAEIRHRLDELEATMKEGV